MLYTNSSSVYFLISELCENLLHEHNPNEPINITSVKKLKSKSYEILLKKSKEYNIDLEEKVNPIKELDIILFASKIKGRNNYKILKNCENLEEHLNYISKEKCFTEENGKNILTFLLHLHNNLLDNEYNGENNLLIPGPFTLHSEFSTNSCYPNMLQFRSSKPEQFRGLNTLMDYQNPYLPKLLFEGEARQFPQPDSPKWINTEDVIQPKPFTFSNLINNDNRDATWSNVPKNTPLNLLNSSFQLKSVRPNSNFSTSSRNSKMTSDDNVEEKRFCWDWENLGHSNITVAKPFTSEVGNSLYLESIIEDCLGNKFIAKIVSIENFIIDLKSLTVGIQSDSFEHDSHIVFHMVPNITIPGVSPKVLKNYIYDFLECGTCYKRLHIMTMKHNYRLMFDGFIFKALCSAVEDYLVMFRQFVYSYDDKTLLNFSKRMKKMMKQISSLSCTLTIHPESDSNIKPPMGSQFLGYLYKEIMRVTQKDLIMLLVYILKRCCHVYFKHLQKWLFYGILDDPSNELFVCFVDHYRQYTKYYYDKAYFVRKESVPGFFQGYEDQILQCGKYAMLLKAFKPNHPLFEIDYPSMSVSLSFNEIEYMEQQCRQYLEKTRKICGKPLTVSDMFKKKAENRNNFFKLVSERTQKNFEKWAADKEESTAAQVAEKKKRFEEITQLLEESKNRKIAEKMANLEFERKILKEIQLKEDKEIELENYNIKKRIDYFKELTSLMEKRKLRIDKDIEMSTTLSLHNLADDNLETPLVTARSDFNSSSSEIDTEYDDCISSVIKTSDNMPLDDIIDENCENNNNEIIISDYLNANGKNSEKVLTEYQKNRNRDAYSDAGNFYGNTILRVETEDTSENDQIVPLTDAQKNKLKVLNQEYGFGNDNKLTDLNSNLLNNADPKICTELSELQKNRLKMMQNDTFALFNQEPNRHKLNLDLNTERYRNRIRVLESEFNIFTGIENSTVTPMSTTSDSAPTIPIHVDSFLELQDTANANYEEDTLKLQINKIDIDKMGLNIPTATIDETPECGLSTAGILAKQGFNFESSKFENSINNNNIEVNLDNQSKKVDNDSPYNRCEELIISNFKCKPISTYFQLNEYGDFEKDENEKIKNLLQSQKDLNSLSVITLTEFLQKSVVTPLNAHLEILNNEVMRLFLEDLDIIGHISSLRNYFFLMDGEFGSIICDELIRKLEICNATPNELMNYQILHSILDTAIGSSIMGNDKNADNLSFIVNDLPEKFDLSSPSVLSNLSLSYRVEWPLNLILNPETLEQYGNIFKYLIKVRRISWVLEESFQMLKEIVKSNGKDMLLSPQYRRVQQIRHKFFHFVHALKNHITSSALQASWKTIKDDLLSARSIEDIYRKHTNYIKKILFLCMLNRRSVEFFNTIENIFKVSLRFYRNLKARQWKKKPGDEFFTHSRYEKLLADENEFEKFIKYTIYLGNKIVKHGYQEEIGEFISLINYNQYYVVDT